MYLGKMIEIILSYVFFMCVEILFISNEERKKLIMTSLSSLSLYIYSFFFCTDLKLKHI